MCDSSWHSWIPCLQNRCPSQTCSRSASSKRKKKRKKKIGTITQRQHWIHLAGLPGEQSCNSSSCGHQSATHSGHTMLPACWEITLSPPHTEILLFRLSPTVAISGHRDGGSRRSYLFNIPQELQGELSGDPARGYQQSWWCGNRATAAGDYEAA